MNEVTRMPPKIRFSREAVVEAAFAIARKDGMEAVNARAIAKELGCSTQPLFREFQTMDQIKDEVRASAMKLYDQSVMRAMMGAEKPYKAAGMAYLHFAKNEPALFKLLFMYDRGKDKDKREGENDPSADYVLEALMKSQRLSREKAKLFHLYSWIYVHGMASMIATNYVDFSDEEMDGLLTGMYTATKSLFAEE